MKEYNYLSKPVKVFGLPFFETNKKLERLTEDMRKQLKSLEFFGQRCPGARICFRTDSDILTVKVKFKTLSFDIGMSIYACQSVVVQKGAHTAPVFLGRVVAQNYETLTSDREFQLDGEMQDITLWLPRNEIIEDISFCVSDGARVEAPTEYKYPPVLFYGSSITETGHCSIITNAYISLLSRWLDMDFYNFGFSGSARGEIQMADIISSIKMSVFVYDYDHNSELDEYREHHEPFFKRVRQAQPDLPVIIMNRPLFENRDEYDERRKIARRTYENAVNAGDENVYFIDSEKFFTDEERPYCSTDNTHPNDMGFYLMAKSVKPVLEAVLKKRFA